MPKEEEVRTPRRNFVAKYAEEFNRPETHRDRTKYRKPKHSRPVHEIDPDDEFIDDEEIWK
jgi:hypothetical protein